MAVLAGTFVLAGPALAEPAVYFTEDMTLGRQKFIDTAAAADAAHNTANPGSIQNSHIYEVDLLRTTGARFSITDPLTSGSIYIETKRAGQPAQNSGVGDLGGDGFTQWNVGYTAGDWNSVVAAGYTVSFFSDASYTTPFMMNALGLNVTNWGTCCALQNTRPDGSLVDSSEIYMLFDGSTPLLVGGINTPIGGTEHFVAAIDDRNAFSSVTLVPNGSGEAFGAGGRLIFSNLALNSVPRGSSLVTIGTPTIDSGLNYTADQLEAGAVAPTFNGGTLLFTTGTEVTQDLQIGNAGGTIDTMAGDATVSGDLSDSSGASGALVKTGSGTLILAGINSYSGGTTVLEGTLRGHSGSLQGDIANSATVDFAQGTDGTYAGTLSGTGDLVKSGTGTLTLTGTHSFAGDTLIEEGVLALAGNGSLAGSGRVVADGTFDIAGTTDGAAIRSLAGSGAVALGERMLTITNGADSFGGAITGTGGLSVEGGTLTLTGASDFIGDTIVTDGAGLTLVGNGSIAGSGRVVADGTFDIAGTASGAAIRSLAGSGAVALGERTLTITNGADNFGGKISGSGGLSVEGGLLTLTGDNSFTGGLTIGSATIVAGGDAALGEGPVTIGAGTLQASAGYSSDNAFVVTSDASAVDTGTFDVALAGPISGAGTLNKIGIGRLTLSGANSQNGIDIREGSVLLVSAGAAGTADGDIVLHRDTSFLAGAEMTLSQHLRVEGANALFDTGSHSIVLTGTGTGTDCLNKTGTGQLTLAAATSNAIGACVRQGTLTFNSTFDGDVWVYEGGTAGGSGIIRGDMDVRGVLAPGNSPGRLVVQGSVTQAESSTLALDIDGTTAGEGAGHFDTLVLTGADSVYTAGGTIAPQLRGITGAATNSYTPEIGATFDVVSAEGGVEGAFTALTQPAQGLSAGSRFEVLYLPNIVRLAVAADSYGRLMTAAGSANAAAVGHAVDATRGDAFARDTTNAGLFSQGLMGRNTAQLTRTLQQAAGEIHAIGLDTVVQANRNSRALVVEHLASQPANPPVGRLWGSAWIESVEVDGDRHGPAYQADLESYLVGLDGQVAPGVILGGAVGYSRARAETDLVGSSDTDSFQLMGYGSWTGGATYVNGIVSVSVDRHEIDRQVELATGTPRLFSRPDGSTLGADVELGHRFDLGSVRLTPLVGVAYDGIGRDAITERGDAIAALSFREESRDAVVGRAGLRLSVPAGFVQPYASAMVSHELADRSTQLRPELNGTRFTTVATEMGRTALRLGAGVTATVARNVAVRVGYRFVGLNDADAHAANAAVSIAF